MTDFESRSADWLPCSAALERILGAASPLSTEDVKLTDSLGRALAADITASTPLPPWDNSAMDGYAVRGADVEGATQDRHVELAVTGVIHAGSRFDGVVRSGQAVRIMTGGPVPDGADTVIRVEDTDREEADPGRLKIFNDRDCGRNVRPAGEDWATGAVVLQAGSSIGPGQVGALAAARASTVTVRRRPTVAIIASGDELTELDALSLDEDRIPESNSHLIAAAVRACGAIPLRLGIASDDPEDLRQHVERAISADVLVTLGGASMGEADLFKRVLDEAGFQLDFWRVKIRPGSPMSFGHLPREMGLDQPVFGLPGNPASTFVTFEVFVRPFLLALAGHARLLRPVITARAGADLTVAERLTGFLRVRLVQADGALDAFIAGPQGSGLVRSLSVADGLAIVPEGIGTIPEGSSVEVMVLDGPLGLFDDPSVES
jgi:molybdopterin molybdotransferase